MNELKSFEDHLDKYRGKKGSDSRTAYDVESLAFRLGIMLKETRKSCNVTQEDLAERTGTKKSYISRIETGKSEIQLSTFCKLIELGLGKTVSINIA